MTREERPNITVVIATKDREDKINDAVDSVINNNYDKFSIIVVDQSSITGTTNPNSIGKFKKQVSYIKSDTVGLSRAKNIGIKNAGTEIIAITDDDCVVPPNWIESIADAFSLNRRIGVVFGNVLPGNHDHTLGFIPTHVTKQPLMAKNIYDKPYLEGISACTALRKSMWEELNGFDNMLGAGSIFKSAEESDLTVKALINGYSVYETPSITVTHNGFRKWDEAYELIKSYWYGTGAMYSKYIKCGYLPILIVLTKLAYKWAFQGSLIIEGLGTRQYRLMRLYSFCRGFYSGLRTPVDRKKQLFIE